MISDGAETPPPESPRNMFDKGGGMGRPVETDQRLQARQAKFGTGVSSSQQGATAASHGQSPVPPVVFDADADARATAAQRRIDLLQASAGENCVLNINASG